MSSEWIRKLVAPDAESRILLSPFSAAVGLCSQLASKIARQRYQRVEAMLSHHLPAIAAEYQMGTGDFLFLLTQGDCPPGICVLWHYTRVGISGYTTVKLLVHGRTLGGIVLEDPKLWNMGCR